MAVPIEACWNSAATVCGLKIDPSNSATYAPTAVFQASENAWPGAENKLPQACSTVVLLNALINPPTTSAATRARTVTVNELPSTIEVKISRARPAPAYASEPGGGSGCSASSGDAAATSSSAASGSGAAGSPEEEPEEEPEVEPEVEEASGDEASGESGGGVCSLIGQLLVFPRPVRARRPLCLCRDPAPGSRRFRPPSAARVPRRARWAGGSR